MEGSRGVYEAAAWLHVHSAKPSDWRAASQFDAAFYTAQGLELVVGAVNITLLGLSARDGLKLTRWRRKSVLRPQ